MGTSSIRSGIRETRVGRRAARATRWSRRPALATVLLVAATLASASAGAANLCIVQSATSTIFVPRFRAPARGKCKPTTAIVVNSLPANGASGQACTTEDGARVLIGLTAFIDGWPNFFEANLSLPVGSPGVILHHRTMSSSNAYGTTAALCSAP